jgi:iron complex transport system ATP-binding protein
VNDAKPFVVELRDVSYRGGGRLLLDGVNWRLGRGESWAILGPNGAGKTLLLRLVAGRIWPNAGGSVLRQGRKLVDLTQLSRHVGWVSSRMAAEIPPSERALDTVVSGRFAQLGLKSFVGDRPQSTDFDKAHELLNLLQCASLAAAPFGVLSQGEQQKILLARALSIDPLAIILDEPCVGLDPGSRERFLAALQPLLKAKSDPALIFVTHHVEEILPSFDRVMAIRGGKIVEQGPPQRVLTAATLATIFERPVHDLIVHNGRCWPIW